jgi:putative transcriptional regulator
VKGMDTRFLTGKLLLAMPGIGDARFERSVTAICTHDEQGAMGIGVGHHMPDVTLHGLLSQFDVALEGVADGPIFCGGPVEPQRGFVMHSLDWSGQGTNVTAGLWGLTATIDILRVIGSPEGPRHWLVALGYAGWGEGQLDGEMTRHGWHLADATDRLLFELPVKERWTEGFRSTGVDPRMLVGESGHA